ncbi:MAG: hypothetical protein M5R40_07155 [Anaerolineae bacterium]|nr:hypothetical protein [Anaerolineae bacterium]
MYITRLILNPRSRRVQTEVARRYELHPHHHARLPCRSPSR